MECKQAVWDKESGWEAFEALVALDSPQSLVVVFGVQSQPEFLSAFRQLQTAMPESQIVGCSTAGEIRTGDIHVIEQSVVATVLKFESTQIQVECLPVSYDKSFWCGENLGSRLKGDNLKLVMVLGDGTSIEGSQLSYGLNSVLPDGVPVIGGLAGDYNKWEETFTLFDNKLSSGHAVAVGFYGESLDVGFGIGGGWLAFGPERTVTYSEGTHVYEIDYQPAFELYKKYLGELADELPGSGYNFPIQVALPDCEQKIIRSLVSIDDEDGSIIFAGAVPEGALVHLMMSNFKSLIEGAQSAAEACGTGSQPDVAILVSCVGRRILLEQLTDEEVDAVSQVLGENTMIAGFYSYGEFSPSGECLNCLHHNQTMTITTLKEG
ncbi:FIST C-terminal domain-containing protein [Parasalinivibrio latis]|uniref:FIST signal transduction protein n=1 Tax=Parasalinivibrio latis TaxID=2952610 RepID=UPI0030E1B516